MSSDLNINCHQLSSRDDVVSLSVKNWALKSMGFFDIKDVYRDLGVADRKGRQLVSNALGRLCDDGTLKRKPNVNGIFRRVMNGAQPMEWQDADTSQILDIKWPFQLEDYVNMYPKNIAIVAGSPDSGKTAFLLNVIHKNQYNFNISYYSSEMGALELKTRLEKFEYPIDAWQFKAFERSSNFADVIDPDGINIIDFLEVSDNFYLVGQELRDIFDVLNNGVAVIALQKKRNTKATTFDLGRGAEFGLEKPRLYLSIDYGKCKIIKAKNWVDPLINPNGIEFDFKIYNGCKFTLMSTREV